MLISILNIMEPAVELEDIERHGRSGTLVIKMPHGYAVSENVLEKLLDIAQRAGIKDVVSFRINWTD